MRIYESAIEIHTQYEGQGNDVLREYGTNHTELSARHNVEAAKIAPEHMWLSASDGSATVSVDGVEYFGYIRKIELVC